MTKKLSGKKLVGSLLNFVTDERYSGKWRNKKGIEIKEELQSLVYIILSSIRERQATTYLFITSSTMIFAKFSPLIMPAAIPNEVFIETHTEMLGLLGNSKNKLQ